MDADYAAKMTAFDMKGIVMNEETKQTYIMLADQYLVVFSHLISEGNSQSFAHEAAANMLRAQYEAYAERSDAQSPSLPCTWLPQRCGVAGTLLRTAQVIGSHSGRKETRLLEVQPHHTQSFSQQA